MVGYELVFLLLYLFIRLICNMLALIAKASGKCKEVIFIDFGTVFVLGQLVEKFENDLSMLMTEYLILRREVAIRMVRAL